MPGKRFRHIFLAGPTRIEGFTNPRHGGPVPRIKIQDRAQHSARLLRKLEAAWREDDKRQAVAHADRNGVYVDFVSESGFDLAVKSLENVRSGIRLLNVRSEGTGAGSRTMATVYVPNEKRQYFLGKINAYAQETTAKGKPKNAKLIDSIADIRRSIVESFWLDPQVAPPGEDAEWVEVWLSSA